MPSADNKRLAKNTLFLYFRMFLVMGVSLFTSRVILNALGVNDFGIYNVVGGIVSLFSIVSASLSSAISRFITFELGAGNKERLCEVFSTSISIQFRIAAIVLLILAPIGFWFLNTKMNISPERIYSANWVFLFSLLSFCVSLLSVPYDAALIAHEHMKTFAYVGILEVALKLGVAYLVYAFNDDRLIFYALLIFSVSVILRIIYGVYCNRHFIECKSKPKYNKAIFKEMSAFAGWNFIGSSSSILRDQGNNIILNLFYGTVVNAAYSIGMQVSSASNRFAESFMTALRPQITKTYAQGDFPKLMSLIYRGSRFSFFLLWIIAIIILLNTNYVLTLWLKNVPEYTVTFVQLFIIFVMSESISQPLITAQLATGKIKWYQICVGGSKLFNLPVSYLLLYLGYSPYVTVQIAIAISLAMLLLRFYFLKNMIGLKAADFVKEVLLPVILVIVVSYPLCWVSTHLMTENFGFLIIRCLIIFAITSITVFLIGCNKSEKKLIGNKINSIVRRKANQL